MAENFVVEVCYAMPDKQERICVSLPPGATIQQAIEASGLILRLHIDLTQSRVGIYGKLKRLETSVRDGDRIEIYRKLIVDPNTARLRRHEKKWAREIK